MGNIGGLEAWSPPSDARVGAATAAATIVEVGLDSISDFFTESTEACEIAGYVTHGLAIAERENAVVCYLKTLSTMTDRSGFAMPTAVFVTELWVCGWPASAEPSPPADYHETATQALVLGATWYHRSIVGIRSALGACAKPSFSALTPLSPLESRLGWRFEVTVLLGCP